MFLDNDRILNQGWWKWVEESKALEDERVGEVWGLDRVTDITRKSYLEACCR